MSHTVANFGWCTADTFTTDWVYAGCRSSKANRTRIGVKIRVPGSTRRDEGKSFDNASEPLVFREAGNLFSFRNRENMLRDICGVVSCWCGLSAIFHVKAVKICYNRTLISCKQMQRVVSWNVGDLLSLTGVVVGGGNLDDITGHNV